MNDVLLHPGNYLSIIIVLVLTGCGLPVPEEIPIIAAGVASASTVGHLDPWAALAACLIGALLGDSVLYAIGYHFGHNLVKAHPRVAQLLHADREEKMEQMINRHGLKVLFVARFMVGIRAPVYLAIGILRISYRKFLLFDAFCAAAVVSVFFGLSYLFGDNVTRWVRDTEKVITALVVAAVVVLLVVLWVRRKRMQDRTHTQEDAAAPDGDQKGLKLQATGLPGRKEDSGNGPAAGN